MKQYLILKWIGRWTLPDSGYSDIYTGPYATRENAEHAIKKYAWDEGKTPNEREYLISRHAVIETNWPEHSP